MQFLSWLTDSVMYTVTLLDPSNDFYIHRSEDRVPPPLLPRSESYRGGIFQDQAFYPPS